MRRLVRSALVKGGVILFRGAGTAARRYLESDRATADEYYLEAGTAVAEFTVTGAHGEAVDARSLSPEEYAAWVDWIDPITGTSMGTPRGAGEGMRGSPRFAEMVINARSRSRSPPPCTPRFPTRSMLRNGMRRRRFAGGSRSTR
jgi:hypothetical protein